MNFILKNGSKGQETKRLQQKLGITADGVFGNGTEKAVKDFQAKNGLTADGVCGAETQRKLGMEVVPGIDVSGNNGSIDWVKVGKTDKKFAFIKLTEGRDFKSKVAKENWDGAKANGLLVGGYHFAKPSTQPGEDDPIAEASFFVKQLLAMGWKKGVDLLPVLDLEDGTKTDDEYNAHWAVSFCETVEKQLGVKPIVYTGKWFWDAYLAGAKKETLDKLTQYQVWWAHYTTDFDNDPNIRGWTSWLLWQWTGSGSCDGITGKVDLDWLCGGEEGLRKIRGV